MGLAGAGLFYGLAGQLHLPNVRTAMRMKWKISAFAVGFTSPWAAGLLQQSVSAPGWVWVLFIAVVVILVLWWVLASGQSETHSGSSGSTENPARPDEFDQAVQASPDKLEPDQE